MNRRTRPLVFSARCQHLTRAWLEGEASGVGAVVVGQFGTPASVTKDGTPLHWRASRLISAEASASVAAWAGAGPSTGLALLLAPIRREQLVIFEHPSRTLAGRACSLAVAPSAFPFWHRAPPAVSVDDDEHQRVRRTKRASVHIESVPVRISVSEANAADKSSPRRICLQTSSPFRLALTSQSGIERGSG